MSISYFAVFHLPYANQVHKLKSMPQNHFIRLDVYVKSFAHN
jgi:hypothetical protein